MKLDNQPHVLRTLAKFVVWKKKRATPIALWWFMEYEEAKLRSEFMMWNWKLHNQPACIVPEIALNMFHLKDTDLIHYCKNLITSLIFCKPKTKKHPYKAIFFKRSKQGCEFEIRIHLGHLACVKNFEALYLQSDFRHVAYVWQISW